MPVRTRVAPSPTGDPHLGTAYTALFALAFARSQGGQFLLRIEDTDQVRSSPESEKLIMESLSWLGLHWDEGPDIGGPFGPYRQSERTHIYRQHLDQLLAKGHAFHCFCSPARLAEMREAQMAAGESSRYDGLCTKLSRRELEQKLAAGTPHVVRMRVPDEGSCSFHDRLRGEIQIDWREVDMQVLLKSDGMPTYHLAVVVDDHLMQVSHIIRGEEWITSVPKHKLLFEYFGWEMPELIHLPLLRNPDKSKLSKRKNPVSLAYYRRLGILPEALVNYLGRMGFSLQDEAEKFPLMRMIDEFDWNRMTPGAPVFDPQKLEWLNGRWIREDLDEDALVERLQEWGLGADFLKKLMPLVQERLTSFSQLLPMAGFLLSGTLALTEEDFAHKKLTAEEIRRILQLSIWCLEGQKKWQSEEIARGLKQISAHLDLGLRDFLFPLFVAVSGSPVSLPLFSSMEVLGPDMTRARLRHALALLGGLSKKQLKRLEKDYAGMDF